MLAAERRVCYRTLVLCVLIGDDSLAFQNRFVSGMLIEIPERREIEAGAIKQLRAGAWTWSSRRGLRG